MFENLKQGWALGKATRQLVFKDKTLLLYPAIAVIVTVIEMIAIFAFLLAGILFAGPSTTASAHPATSGPIIGFLFLLGLYVLITFTTTYITMAMFIAFRSNVAGKKIGILASLSQTAPYWFLILEWSVFYGIIITLVRIIESRLRGIAQFIFGAIISIALALATMFVVQIILDDKVGPVEAMRRSEKTLIGAFGKTFGGIIYSDLYGLIFTLLGIGLIIISVSLAGVSAAISIVGLIVGVALLILGVVITGVLSSIYRLILYDYIKTGKLPQGFTKQMVDSSIKQKKQSGNQQRST
jgi:hypothetical protein